jgi:mono/diheme cytochrome c family protein
MRRSEILAVVLLLLGIGVVSALAEEAPLSYAKDVLPLFTKECSDCHGAKKPKKGLDLLAPTSREDLVNRSSQEVPEMALVKPGDPDGSYLWKKLTHTATEGKGMPRTRFSSKMLEQTQLDLVRRWIEGGAKP